MAVNTTSVKAKELIYAMRNHSLMAATAESCTGGLVAAALTNIPGSSEVFDRGFVTYSNAAKQEMLGVPQSVLEAHGAVSAQTARAMAEGGLVHSRADLCVAITGVAGPGGGTAQKPVGLVHFACARRGGGLRLLERRFPDAGRAAIRAAAVGEALDLLLAMAQEAP